MDTRLVKGWLQSKGVWGGIVGALSGLLALGHYTLSADDAKSVVELITGIITDVGSIYAIYGRVMATHTIVAAPVVDQQAGGR
jgi:hypothetical protein